MTATDLRTRHQEAAERAAALAAAALRGDPGTSTEELLAAEAEERRLADAVAREESIAAERQSREAEAARVARWHELDRLVAERFGEGDAEVVEAFDAARQALDVLVARAVARNAALRVVVDEMLALGEPPEGVRIMAQGAGRQIHVPTADVFIKAVDVEQLAAEAAWRACHAEGVQAPGLGRVAPVSINPSPAERERFGTDLPGLSDELRRIAKVAGTR